MSMIKHECFFSNGIVLGVLLCVVCCVVPENIHTPPTEGIGNSWGVGGFQSPKDLSKCMKLDWNFQRGGGLRKNPFREGGLGMDNFWNHTMSFSLAFIFKH